MGTERELVDLRSVDAPYARIFQLTDDFPTVNALRSSTFASLTCIFVPTEAVLHTLRPEFLAAPSRHHHASNLPLWHTLALALRHSQLFPGKPSGTLLLTRLPLPIHPSVATCSLHTLL